MSANSEVLTRLLELLNQGVCLLDAKGRITTVNQSFLDAFNPPAGLLAPNKPFAPFIDWLGRKGEKEAADTLRDLTVAKKTSQRELRLSAGRYYDCRSRNYGASGHIVTLADISQQRRLESKDKLLAQALDAIADGFGIFDSGDRLVIMNRRYLGYAPNGAE